MERDLSDILARTGDPAGASLLRRVAADLAGPLQVVVLATDLRRAERVAAPLGATALVARSADDLGLEDRLLGAHVLLWATPLTAPLGQQERELLGLLGPHVPSRRAVLLAGTELLARMSDDPEAEAAEVRARLQGLVPDDWELIDDRGAPEWLAATDREALAATRLRQVARHLVADALRRADLGERELLDARERIDVALAREDADLARARRDGDRTAAHILAAQRERTEELLADLRAFLRDLADDLADQVGAVDLEVARRTLLHWLHHVVETWVAERLDQWRLDLLSDLERAHVDADPDAIDLLLPALHAGSLPSDPSWGPRLGATAAVGGGVALAMAGLIPVGAIVAVGGLAWSALGRASRRARSRERLVEGARAALQHMGEDADRVLREQILQREDALASLGEERAATLAATRATVREELTDRRAQLTTRLEAARATRQDLADHVHALDPALLPEPT